MRGAQNNVESFVVYHSILNQFNSIISKARFKCEFCLHTTLHLLLRNPNPPLLGGGDQLLDRDLQPNPPRLPAGDLDLDLLL